MRLSRNLIAAALAACSTAIFAQATTPGSPGAPAVGTQTSPGVLGPAPSSPGVVGGTFGTQPGVITTTPGATTTQPGISPNVYGSSMPGTASPGLATPGSASVGSSVPNVAPPAQPCPTTTIGEAGLCPPGTTVR